MFKKLRRLLLVTAGTIFTAIGLVGIFVPILPTTPFLLLAAACYMRSSQRFYRWLLNNRVFGLYIRHYLEGKGLTVGTKLFTICLLWTTIGLSIWIGTQNTVIRLILIFVAAGVTLHIAFIKPKRNNKKSNASNEKEVFDKIAPGWYNFRHRTIFPGELAELAERWRGGRLLNIGCAHGPDFVPFKEAFDLHGIDFSRGMLEQAQKYATKYNFKVSLVEADARALPYADGFFDWAIAVATYHHIDTREGRSQAFRELFRVLRPGGEAFITVWNRWQPRFWLKSKDTRVPWRSRGGTLYRYYHLFSCGELEKAARQAGFEILKSLPESRYKFPLKMFSRNICLLVRKP